MEAEWRICASTNQAIIASDNGLSPGRCQAIIWSNVDYIVIYTITNKIRWNFDRNSHIFIQENAFENVLREMRAAFLSRPQVFNCVFDHNYKTLCVKNELNGVFDHDRHTLIVEQCVHCCSRRQCVHMC